MCACLALAILYNTRAEDVVWWVRLQFANGDKTATQHLTRIDQQPPLLLHGCCSDGPTPSNFHALSTSLHLALQLQSRGWGWS